MFSVHKLVPKVMNTEEMQQLESFKIHTYQGKREVPKSEVGLCTE